MMRGIELSIHARDGRKWRGYTRLAPIRNDETPSQIYFSGGLWKFIGFNLVGVPVYRLYYVSDESRIFDYVGELSHAA